jgi:hypothetical protein
MVGRIVSDFVGDAVYLGKLLPQVVILLAMRPTMPEGSEFEVPPYGSMSPSTI